jgi:endonuclease/exonuclease/phosphatase family metal-dependent hydrolase
MSRKHIKVGTFNLYNLALPGERYYNRTCRHNDFTRKVEWSASQLNRMDADIIGFQEVFHQEALQQVLDATGRYEGAEIVMSARKGEGPAVAMASRFEVMEYTVYTDFPVNSRLEFDDVYLPLTEFSRPVLSARVQLLPGLYVTVFVVHLKSKRPKVRDGADPHDPRERALGHARSLMIRAAEATALRYLLLDVLKDTDDPVIIMGDFNDAEGAVTSKIMGGSPPWRRLPTEVKREIWDVLLYNVKDIQARQSYHDVYYTHLHNGHYDSLDHILVSQEFVRQNPARLGFVEYVKVFNDHLIDETLSNDRVPLWESDHGQVITTIQLEKGIPGEW